MKAFQVQQAIRTPLLWIYNVLLTIKNLFKGNKYIGLRDRKGIMVFVSDVVMKFGNAYHIVEYKDQFWAKSKEQHFYLEQEALWGRRPALDPVIVGNMEFKLEPMTEEQWEAYREKKGIKFAAPVRQDKTGKKAKRKSGTKLAQRLEDKLGTTVRYTYQKGKPMIRAIETKKVYTLDEAYELLSK